MSRKRGNCYYDMDYQFKHQRVQNNEYIIVSLPVVKFR